MNSPIRAFLFDFGGVFTDSPFLAVEEFGRELGVDPAIVTAIVFGSYEDDGHHPWHRLERGEIALEDAREAIRALGAGQALDIDIYRLFARMAGTGAGAGTRAALVGKVRELRAAGFHTGMITNNVREFGEGWGSLLPVEELFGFVVDSSHAGVRKPDPRIFALALEQLPGVQADECVFLDDYAANVRAARELGMSAIHVGTDPAATVAAIEALLGC
ncbi:MAG: HAD family phosphatase [Gammaproteobacteria bacterium]|nr:HAD family phosphatase [Gammaproteobacteria bacterium]